MEGLEEFLQGKNEVAPNELYTFFVERGIGYAISQSPATVDRIMTGLGYCGKYVIKDGYRRLIYKKTT